MLQIAVDTSFGLMPVRRARSEFVADARTVIPKRVLASSHHRPSVITGTTMRTSSWEPSTVMLLRCHSPEIGVGYAVCSAPVR